MKPLALSLALLAFLAACASDPVTNPTVDPVPDTTLLPPPSDLTTPAQ